MLALNIYLLLDKRLVVAGSRSCPLYKASEAGVGLKKWKDYLFGLFTCEASWHGLQVKSSIGNSRSRTPFETRLV